MQHLFVVYFSIITRYTFQLLFTEVTITGPDEAEIRYTTDGSTPTAESSLYSEALTLSDTTTVKAIAIKNGVSSEVSTKTFIKSSGNGDDLDQ